MLTALVLLPLPGLAVAELDLVYGEPASLAAWDHPPHIACLARRACEPQTLSEHERVLVVVGGGGGKKSYFLFAQRPQERGDSYQSACPVPKGYLVCTMVCTTY